MRKEYVFKLAVALLVLVCASDLFCEVTSTPTTRAAGLFKRAMQRRRAAKVAAQPKSLAQITKDVNIVAETLSEGDVHQFLRKANLVNKKMLNVPKCIMVQKASSDGGSFTENLFYVFYYPECQPRKGKKLLFVLKELKQKSAEQELYNLYQLQNSPELRALGGVRNANFPQITFSEDFYRFRTPSGDAKYILLIHGARGQSLNDIYKGKTAYKPVQAFRTFGRVLGHFNHAFLRGKHCLLKGGKSLKACVTLNHGDLHPKNVFYDGTYIYFIDTETLARSLNQRTPLALDLIYFYNMPVYAWTSKVSPSVFYARKKIFDNLFRYARHAYVKALTKKATERHRLNLFIKHFTRDRVAAMSFIKAEHDFIRERGSFSSITKKTAPTPPASSTKQPALSSADQAAYNSGNPGTVQVIQSKEDVVLFGHLLRPLEIGGQMYTYVVVKYDKISPQVRNRSYLVFPRIEKSKVGRLPEALLKSITINGIVDGTNISATAENTVMPISAAQ